MEEGPVHKEFSLHSAIIDRDLRLLSDRLDQGEFIDSQDELGNTALHLATSYDFVEAVDLLLRESLGGDLDLHNKSGDCPLHIAIKNKNLEIFCKLLENDANIDIQDKRGNTALMLAVITKFESGTKILLEIDTMKFEDDEWMFSLITLPHEFRNKDGNTCLHLIVLEKNLSLLEKFLKKFPNCCTRISDQKGRSPFHLALANGFQHGCEMLLNTAPSYNQDIEKDTGNTVFHTAVLNKNFSTLKQLLAGIIKRRRYSCFICEKNKDGDTAFNLAAEDSTLVAIKLFLTVLLIKRCEHGDNPYQLHNAVLQQNESLLRLLLRRGFDANARDDQRRTPLHWSILTKFSPGVRLLLANSADVNADDSFGNTALYYSILGKSVEFMEILVDNGANINCLNCDGERPISLAVRKNFQSGFNFLLARGAEIGQIANTVLHNAVKNYYSYGSTFLNTLLTKEGIDLNSIDLREWTVLHVAAKEGLLSIVKYILDTEGNCYDGTNSFTPLHAAVCQEKGKQNIEIIRKLLCASGIDVNISSKKGKTPLQLASKHKYAAAVNILLDNGARVDESDHEGNTALHYALKNCDSYDIEEIVLVVDILLSNGADINKSNKYGKTAIKIATTLGLEDVACFLIERGADIRVFDQGCSLYEAVRNAKVSKLFLEKLLKLGLDPNIKGYRKTPLLYLAVKKSFVTTVKLLLDHGANVDFATENKQLILPLAASLRNRLILEYFINKGADINQKNKLGNALHSAVISKRYQNVKLLIEKNINLNDANYEGSTALHEASRGYSHEKEEVVLNIMKLLVDHGADINQKTKNCCTAIHIATDHKEENLTKFFINNNANINEQDSSGNTPLHRAVIKKHVDIVRLLVKSNANLHLKNNYGMTVLHLVVKHHLTECLDLLLDNYSEINVIDGKNETCIHIAVSHRYVDILKKLLARGADTNVKNEDGLTATLLAASKNFKTEVCLLLERDISPEEASNDRKEKALLNAVLKRNKQSVKSLIKRNANVNCKKTKSALHLSVLRNFVIGVKALIEAGADVNNKDSNGNSPLHLAAIVKSTTIMKILLTNGADLECRNEDNRTPAHLAALINFQEGLEFLFNQTASLQHKGSEGTSVIYLALLNLNLNINDKNIKSDLHFSVLKNYGFGVRAVIKDGSKISENSPPLRFRSLLRGESLSNILLTWRNECLQIGKGNDNMSISLGPLSLFFQGVNLHLIHSCQDDTGNTPFILDFLLQNVKSELCLHLAILLNYDFGAKSLIKTGVNVNQVDAQGNTPLHLAVIVKNTAIMDMLISHGARFHSKNELGQAAIHLAAETKFAEGISMLLKRGSSVDIQDINGNTPLHIAINIDPSITVLLMENGAKMDIANRGNETFLSMEQHGPRAPIVRRILGKLKIAFEENYDPQKQTLHDSACKSPMELEEVWHEVIMMKSRKFGTDSLFDVLKYHKDPKFIVNNPLKETIVSVSLEKNFPHFATILKARFKRLETRYLQLNEACTTLSVDLPMEIRRYILTELSTEDLVSVIDSKW